MHNKLQTLQRAVYTAHARKVEVETRDLGWSAKDADSAENDFNDAVNSYKSAFDCEPEFEQTTDIMGFRYPLYNASTKRLMEIASCE